MNSAANARLIGKSTLEENVLRLKILERMRGQFLQTIQIAQTASWDFRTHLQSLICGSVANGSRLRSSGLSPDGACPLCGEFEDLHT